jgi:outer membrane receptor protein involved in Fe transport
VPFVPKRRANLALDWAATPWLAVRVEGQYIGPYHAIGDFLNDAPEQGGYTTVDAAVSANWGDVDVTLRADNLLDRDYDALVSYVTFLGPNDRLTYQPVSTLGPGRS